MVVVEAAIVAMPDGRDGRDPASEDTGRVSCAYLVEWGADGGE